MSIKSRNKLLKENNRDSFDLIINLFKSNESQIIELTKQNDYKDYKIEFYEKLNSISLSKSKPSIFRSIAAPLLLGFSARKFDKLKRKVIRLNKINIKLNTELKKELSDIKKAKIIIANDIYFLASEVLIYYVGFVRGSSKEQAVLNLFHFDNLVKDIDKNKLSISTKKMNHIVINDSAKIISDGVINASFSSADAFKFDRIGDSIIKYDKLDNKEQALKNIEAEVIIEAVKLVSVAVINLTISIKNSLVLAAKELKQIKENENKLLDETIRQKNNYIRIEDSFKRTKELKKQLLKEYYALHKFIETNLIPVLSPLYELEFYREYINKINRANLEVITQKKQITLFLKQKPKKSFMKSIITLGLYNLYLKYKNKKWHKKNEQLKLTLNDLQIEFEKTDIEFRQKLKELPEYLTAKSKVKEALKLMHLIKKSLNIELKVQTYE